MGVFEFEVAEIPFPTFRDYFFVHFNDFFWNLLSQKTSRWNWIFLSISLVTFPAVSLRDASTFILCSQPFFIQFICFFFHSTIFLTLWLFTLNKFDVKSHDFHVVCFLIGIIFILLLILYIIYTFLSSYLTIYKNSLHKTFPLSILNFLQTMQITMELVFFYILTEKSVW